MFTAPFSADTAPIQFSPCQTGDSTGLFHNVTNCWPGPAKSLLDCVTDKRLVHIAHYGRSLQEGPPCWNVGVEMQHENSIQDEISAAKDIKWCLYLEENPIKKKFSVTRLNLFKS